MHALEDWVALALILILRNNIIHDVDNLNYRPSVPTVELNEADAEIQIILNIG